MDNEKLRAEFEKWADDNGFRIGERPLLWLAWQASRAALVVELPKWFTTDNGPACHVIDILDSLGAAGITVKEGV